MLNKFLIKRFLKKKKHNLFFITYRSYFLVISNIFKYKYSNFSLNVIKFFSHLDFFFFNFSQKYSFVFFMRYFLKKKDLLFDFRFKKKVRIWPDFLKVIIYFKNLNPTLLLKLYSFLIFFRFYFDKKITFSNLGNVDKIEITGYSRRSWLSPTLKFINFKVGHSFVNKIIIPNKIFLNLFKKRFIILFSPSKRALHKFSNTVFNLKPITVYKNSGISLNSVKVNFKERFIQK